MRDLKLFSSVSGLNTKVDPVRLPYNGNVSDLAEAVNVSIDNTGRATRRSGWSKAVAGEFHSLWSDNGDCFVIKEGTSDASIMQVAVDLSLAGVRSGLTMDRRMSWVDVNGLTFYTNGRENGYIEEGVSKPWPTGTYSGPDTSRSFIEAPVGSHLTFRGSRLHIAHDNTLWTSEPHSPGMYDPARGFWQFPTRIRMIKAVAAGIFVSDEKRTYYLQGNSPIDFVQTRVAPYPAHEWSVAHELVELDDLGFEGGEGAVWSSSEGLCVGLPSGQVINLTKKKLDYPDYTKGATLICGYHAINTMY